MKHWPDPQSPFHRTIIICHACGKEKSLTNSDYRQGIIQHDNFYCNRVCFLNRKTNFSFGSMNQKYKQTRRPQDLKEAFQAIDAKFEKKTIKELWY